MVIPLKGGHPLYSGQNDSSLSVQVSLYLDQLKLARPVSRQNAMDASVYLYIVHGMCVLVS